ncbi:DUF5777 family beta-barrel protein [Ferruginibacter sp. SUN002]|uniref:DUF5777 family beta-barrel protein n=1 Tax=Ferruginibacter sp. SUN002 TaxID=2937789 RepID=UPI003D36DABF
MPKKLTLLLLVVFITTAKTFAQDTTDVMSQLENETKKDEIIYTTGTFKTTRLVTGQSTENTAPGVLDLRINHRFGQLNSGIYNMFGLDEASMRWGFDYGITKNIMAGFGRSTFQKVYDVFFKIKLLRQSTGKINMPITLSYVPVFAINTLKTDPPTTPKPSFSDRLSVTNQLIIGRKFSEAFSLQLMPTHIYRDKVPNVSLPYTKRNNFAMGIGGRHKISRRVSINAEYYYQLPETQASLSTNVLSLGVDIETGGHVFQLHFTNSRGMTEKAFIGETTGKWDNGDILFGFNISRVFNVKKAKNHW